MRCLATTASRTCWRYPDCRNHGRPERTDQESQVRAPPPLPLPRRRPAEARRGIHRLDQGVPAGPAHLHRTGGPHARFRHRAFAAQVPRAGFPASRASSPTPRTSNATTRRSPRPPRAKFWKLGTTEEGRDKVVLAIADEATIASSTNTKACWPNWAIRARSAKQQRPGADPHRQAHLLRHQRHPLARNRRPGNAHRAGLPPDRRRDAVHPDTSATTPSS